MNTYSPGRFQVLPPVVKNLVIINAIMLLATYALGGANIDLTHYLGLHYWRSPYFQPWQLITHLFMHGGFMHLFSNMLALWMFGSVLENRWGPKRFLQFYFICGIGAALCHMGTLAINSEPIYSQIRSMSPSAITMTAGIEDFYRDATVGASGAIFGILFAFGYLYPDLLIYFYFFIPMKAKWFVGLYAAFELYQGIVNSAGDNIAHFAHLGGMLFAFILLRVWQMPYGGSSGGNIRRWR
jgi:membrane associated rhomboid family serine protease